VIVARPFEPCGSVVPSELPAGRAVHLAMAGSFEGLPRAWQALFDWCRKEKLATAGINWEIYGATRDAELYALLA
jgi:effector-binding domain-containing protein